MAATANTTDSLDVSWTAPGANGAPPLTGYKLRYRKGMTGAWTDHASTVTGTSATIGSLDAGESYQVQVQALNGETPSDWSPSGTGLTASTVVAMTLSLSLSPATVAENAEPTTVTVTAELNAALATATTVTVADAGTGTATSGTDYTAIGDVTVTIDANQTGGTAMFSFTPSNDTDAESDETVVLSASATGFDPGTATLTITDDDTPTAIALSVNPDSVAEDATATTVTVTAELNGSALSTATTVSVSQTGGTATSGTDYTAISGFDVTIAAQATSGTATFSFTPTNDTAAEPNETVVLSGSATGLDPGTATLTITDDDTPTAIALSVDPASVAEDDSATDVTVTAELNAPAPTATTVTVADAGTGTATSGTDYTAISGFDVTIAAQATSGTATFSFTPTNDTAAEPSETVVLSGSATGLESGTATLTITDDDTPTAITLSVSPDSVAEDATATMVTVTAALDGSALSTATEVTVTDAGTGSATSGTDYTAVNSFTVTINASQTSGTATFSFTPTNDTDAEPNETVVLSGSAPGLTGDTATLTITDDDTPTAIALSVDPDSVAEDATATTVTVTAELDGAALSTATEVTVTDAGTGTATSGTDYEAINSFTVTIDATQTSGTATFTLTPTDDSAAEDSETVVLSGAADGLESGTATLTITDDDTPTAIALSVDPDSVAEDAGATDVTVTAELNAPAPTATTVTVADAGTGTATSGTDYTAIGNFTVTIAASASSGTATLSFAPSNDTDAESDETVALSGTSGSLESGTATLTITDDDTPTAIALSVNPDSVAEDAGATMVTVTAALDGSALSTATTVSVSRTGGTATSGTDYTAISSFDVTIAAQATSGTSTFSFTPTNDTAAEPNETVVLSGSATGLDPGTATLTITDDDTPTAIALSVNPDSVAEDATATTVTVTAELNGSALPTATTVSVSRTGGTAMSGTDYTAISSFDVTIAAQATSGTATFSFTPTNDTAAEPNETVVLSGSATGLDPGTATLTITDDDTPTAIALSVNPDSVAEDAGATTVTVTATLDKSARTTATTVTVSRTGGTATSGTDYTAVSNFTVTINANQTSGTATFMFTPTDDNVAESDETVILSGSATDLTGDTAILTITDDDTASTAIALSVSPSSAAEDAGVTTVTVTATLDEAARGAATSVTVSRTGGTATSGTDYATVNNFTLTIAANQTSGSATFTFTPTDDSVAESDETVILSGSAPGLTGDTATLTITDDDTASTAVALNVSPDSAAEDAGATTVTVTATLDEAARTTATTVTVSRTGGTATSGTDYAAVGNFTVTIAANQTSGTGTFTFTPTDDSVAESDETVILSGSATDLTGDTAILTITDDDTASTAIALSVSPGIVAEDAGATTVTVTATLDEAARPTATSVTVSRTGGTATSGTDYAAVSNLTLTIAANQTSGSATFTFTPTDDSVAESDETVILTASATDVTGGTARLTISDDDTSAAIGLSVRPDSVAEGGGARSITVTATLDASGRAVPTNVVVSLHSYEAGFGPGQDAAAVEPFAIMIEPGRTSGSRSFTLQPHDDSQAEGTESIEVRGEATGLRVESATLELTDDDAATVNLAVPYKSRHAEGGGATHVTVEATLGAVRSKATVVTVRVRGSGRSGAVDFAAVDDFELTIPAGERRNTEGGFMLYPENDDEAEADETLTISGRASGLRVTSATFVLEDDDGADASTKVVLELDETRLAESGGAHVNLTVTGTLDGAPRGQDTVVTLTPSNRTSDGSEVSALVDSGMRLTIREGRISGRRTFGIVLNTPGIDQQDGLLTLGGTADGLTVEPATLALLDGDAPPDRITLTLSETSVPEGWRGTVWVNAEMTPSARAEDTVVTLKVTGTGASGAVDFEPVPDFELTIPKEWETYGASFELLTEEDGEAGRDETLTVSGTTNVAGLRVRSATVTLVDGDSAQALDFAYFANGDSITSEIVLLNLAPHPARPAIQFSDPGGDPIAPASLVDVTRDLRIIDDGRLAASTEMEPMGMLTISTRGEGPLVTGSVTVRSDGPIGGFLRHRVPEFGVAVMASGEPVRDALLPARSRAGGIRTAVALHNLGAQAMVVRCRLIRGGVALEAGDSPSRERPGLVVRRERVRGDRDVGFPGVGALHRARGGTVHGHGAADGRGQPHVRGCAGGSRGAGGRRGRRRRRDRAELRAVRQRGRHRLGAGVRQSVHRGERFTPHSP